MKLISEITKLSLIAMMITGCGAENNRQDGNLSRSIMIIDEEMKAIDGKQFCRVVESDGMFGQPVGKRNHCVSFHGIFMTDGANTFFGNPPETLEFKIEEGKISIRRDGEWQITSYSYIDQTFRMSDIEMAEWLVLDGKTFCRTIISDGFFGQPAGEREACLSFNGINMTDNANTFFGNPPETLEYSRGLENPNQILVIRDEAWVESGYIIEGKTIVIGETGAVYTQK